MRILDANYSVEGSNCILFIEIIDKTDENKMVVATEKIDDIISEKQANKLCKQMYIRYNCDKMVLNNNLLKEDVV